MFGPAYFGTAYFGPSYFGPGADGLEFTLPKKRHVGGASFVRRRDVKSFNELLSLQSDTGEFELEIPPISVEETAASIGSTLR